MSKTSEKSLISRAAAHSSWARTSDRPARTSRGRQAFLDRFEQQVDPNGVLPPAERTLRAAHARKAYFSMLAAKSAAARRRRAAADRAS